MTDLVQVSKQADQQTITLVDDANALQVFDDGEYAQAGNTLLGWTKLKKAIKDTFDPVVKAAHQAHKEAISGRDKHLTVVEDACGILKGKMADYHAAMQAMEKDQQKVREGDVEEFSPMSAPPPEVKGISHRVTWSAQVTDPQILVQFCLDNWDQWGQLIQVDQVGLNKLARSMQTTLEGIIPGVTAVSKGSIAARA